MNTLKTTVATLLTTMLLTLFATESRASSLHDAVGGVCEKLCRYLEAKGETQIAIGQFVGPPQIASTSGPGIVKVFHDYFEQHGIKVVKRANIGLKGEYSLTKLPHEGVGIKIYGSLVDPFGDVLTDFSLDADGGGGGSGSHDDYVVDDHKDIAHLLGATTEIYTQDREIDRNRDLKKQILHPQLYVDQHKCGPSKGSPYRMEVLVHGQPAPIDVTDGLGFVKIDRHQIYAVRIYNNSPYDAAVRLSIDGLNVFTFSQLRKPDGRPKYKFYIVPAHKMVTLKGWHLDNHTVSSFKVTSYADSAAASINHQHDIGTITAVFSAAWPKGGKKPHDENYTAKGGRNATGFGPPVSQVVQEVQREVGQMRASISLRYAR